MRIKPDLWLLAALEISEILPSTVVRTLIKQYDIPVPINYETALEHMLGTLIELAESGEIQEELESLGYDEETNELPSSSTLSGPGLVQTWDVCIHCLSAFAAGGDGLLALGAKIGHVDGIGPKAGLILVMHQYHENGHTYEH